MSANDPMKRRAHLTDEERNVVRAKVSAQLGALYQSRKLQNCATQPPTTQQKPHWHGEITKRQLDAVFPHTRRGSKVFCMGRDAGYFFGGLRRDQLAVRGFKPSRAKRRFFLLKGQKIFSSKKSLLRELERDIEDCMAEKVATLTTLSANEQADYVRGFGVGVNWASEQPSLLNETDVDRLWNRMPEILTRCKSVPDVFRLLHKCEGRVDANSAWPAFQKLCMRLGLKFRPSGRPRKA